MYNIKKETEIKKFNKFFNTTQIRKNIINWYDFKPNSNILEIGCDLGQVTNFFGNLNVNVTSIEYDNYKYEEASKTLSPFKNINLVNDNLIDYYSKNIDDKFDYIIVTSSMDRIDKFVKEEKKYNAFNKFLEIAYSLLKDNGNILIAVDNKFAIRNFSGATFNGSKSFEIIEGKVKNSGIFSKKKLVDLLDNSKFDSYKFYYPFPDYKLPSVIYTDAYLPNKNSNKLKYLLYYNPKDTIIFNELDVIKEIVKDEKLDYFSNSYFVEISKNKENLCKAKFVSFNNFRKKKNKLITKIYDDYAIKQNIYEEGIEHIKNIEKYINILKENGINIIDEVKENTIYSKYQKLSNLNDVIIEYILDKNIESALDIIDNWYKFMKDKFSNFIIDYNNESIREKDVFDKYLVEVAKEKKDKLTFLEYGFFDLIFENIFVDMKDGKINDLLVYDQEWCENNLPIEFILYRALNNLFYYNNKISKYLFLEELYKRYNIEEFINEFKELENRIQDDLTDKEIVNIYQDTYLSLTTIEGLSETLYYSQKECNEVRQEYNNFIKTVEKTNESWQKYLDAANEKIKILEQKLNEKNNIINDIKGLFKKY